MLFPDLIPGDDIRLSYKSLINEINLIAFLYEPYSRALCKARIAVESIDGHGKFHVGIELFKSSRDVLFDPRDLVISLEYLPQDRENIDVLIVLGIPLEDPEEEQSCDRKVNAYDEAYYRCENLEYEKSRVDQCLNDLPDKARSLHRECGNDDFPVVYAGIDAVIKDRDRDDGNSCEKISS